MRLHQNGHTDIGVRPGRAWPRYAPQPECTIVLVLPSFCWVEEKKPVSSVPSGPKMCAQPEPPVGGWDHLKFFRLATAIIWTAVVVFLCWLPGNFVKEIEQESSWFRMPSLDKAIHAGIFVILPILWRRLSSSRREMGAIILGGVGLGALTELGQLLPIVRRNADLYDFATDCVAVIFGVAIAPVVEPLLRAIERRILRLPSPAEPGEAE
jgi:hypothetical protein